MIHPYDPINLQPGNGVYLVAQPSVGARYVGQGNVQERVAAHRNGTGGNSCITDVMSNSVRLGYAIIDDATLDDVERTVYERYNDLYPGKLCNKELPPGKVIELQSFPFE